MTIIGLDHVQLSMPPGGEDLARAFYAGLLGIPERHKPLHLAARGGCWFENCGLKIHLGVEVEFQAAKKAHPALVVKDLAVLAARLADVGIVAAWDGQDHCYVADPFGNRIELLQR